MSPTMNATHDALVGIYSTTGLTPAATSLAVCSFLSCMMLILPLVLKIRSRNIPVSTILASVILYGLFRGTNALIWPAIKSANLESLLDGSAALTWNGEGLCDVEVKLLTALDVSIPSGLLCLFRQLSRIMKKSRLGVTPSKMQKRRTAAFDICFCIALPVFCMPASFVVQPARYYILPLQGCLPVFQPTLIAYPLVLLWPIVITLVSLIYGGIATVRMIKHYSELSKMFADLPHGSRMKREIFKTYIFAFIVYMVRSPFVLYTFIIRNKVPYLQPFSWSTTHPSFWPKLIYIFTFSSNYEVVFGFTSILFAWLALWCFGTGQDAADQLRSWKLWLKSLQKK